MKHFNAQEFNQAIPHFDEAIADDPDFAEAYFARGSCKYYLKSMDGALLDLNSAIRLKEDLGSARALRGAVNYESDRWDEALEDFNAVLKQNPRDAQSLLGRAVINLKRNNMVSAAQDFRGFLSVRPQDPLAPKVRELLASMKQAPGEPSVEEKATGGPGSPKASPFASHSRRSPNAEDLNALADSLLHNPLSDSYSRQVMRGENAQAVGDIHAVPSAPQSHPSPNAGVEIVEPR